MARADWIADAHNDLLLEVAWRLGEGEENPFREHWLPKLERGGVRLQVCPIFVGVEHVPEAALKQALRLASAFLVTVRENADRVYQVRTSTDLDEAESGGRIGLVLALEGAEPLGSSPELIDAFWELGVRMVGLSWSRRNAFAEGSGEPAGGGLSRLGEELVDRLIGLGAVIDLAHASDRTFRDVLARAHAAALAVSHACCRAVHDTPRNVSDEQLRALAERDGFFGLMALPTVVDPEQLEIGRFIDHLDHAVRVMGAGRVGLGGDFLRQIARSGATRVSARERAFLSPGLDVEAAIEGLAGPEDYQAFVKALRGRSYDGERLEGVLHGNLVRFLRRALPS